MGTRRVELRQGTASELPYEPNSFDAAFAINVAQFWDKPAEIAREVVIPRPELDDEELKD